MTAEVQRELSDTIFTQIEWVSETASTNSDLLEVAAGRRAFGGWQLGARQAETEAGGHGSVLVADYQNGGRGRMGRSWAAPRGSALLMSVLLRPTGWEVARLALLTQAMAVSTLETCRSLGAEVEIKWPNDLVGCFDSGSKRETSSRGQESAWKNAWRQRGGGSKGSEGTPTETGENSEEAALEMGEMRGGDAAAQIGARSSATKSRASSARAKEMKLAGVLAETAPPVLTGGGRGDEPRWTDAAVVVGLGLNLRWSEELERAVSGTKENPGEGVFQSLPPVSLDQLVGKPVSRNELLVQVLTNFDRWYRRLDGETTGAEALVRKLGSCCLTLGRSVSVSTPGGVVEGTAVGLTEGGHLILETGREVTDGGKPAADGANEREDNTEDYWMRSEEDSELGTSGTNGREGREKRLAESSSKRKDETEGGGLSGAELEARGERGKRVVISAGDCIHLR